MVSDKCKVVLRNPPPCDDKKEKMRWLMCYAREKIEEGYSYQRAMKEAWSQVRSYCPVRRR